MSTHYLCKGTLISPCKKKSPLYVSWNYNHLNCPIKRSMYTLRMKLFREYSYNEIWDLEIWIFINAKNFLQKSILQSKTHSNWVLKNPELYWGTLPKLVDHWWDLKLCYVVSSSSWLWWELLKVCSICYDYKLKRLCDETFGIAKYCLNLEIEILDIYPFIAFVEAF